MMNKELSAGTNDEQRTAADSLPSASLVQNGMLADAVQEGNKLIAHFMDEYDLYWWERDPFNERLRATYHSSWNQLMPIVEKIEKSILISRKHRARVEIKTFGLVDHVTKIEVSKNIDFESKSVSKINSVWQAVVEFIKWYNAENNKSA